MKAQIKVRPELIIEVEAPDQKDLFKQVASAYEIFGEKQCGLCKSTDIIPAWREPTRVVGKKTETFEYAELRCRACHARLSFGKRNDESGMLFPHRKLLPNGATPGKDEKERAKATYGPHNGWSKYRGEKEEE